MKRINAFDYLRAIAIIGIVVCHFCYNFSETNWLGGWCGGTFNALFLTMSGLLLGMAWNKKGRLVYGLDFLKHRFVRLSKVYYPFLVLMFTFCLAVGGYHIGIKDVAMHLAYLPWFDKLDGFGHLWFMTMIAFCYLTVVPVSRMKILNGGGNFWKYGLLIVVAVLLQTVVSSKGLPGYMFTYLALFVIMFDKAPEIVEWCGKRQTIGVLLGVAVISCTLICYYCDWHEGNDVIAKLLGIAAAMACLCIAMVIFRNVKESKVVSFVANISFEIYLVHHVFAFGRFSVMNLTDSWLLGFLLLMTISVAGGYALNKVTSIKLTK